MILSKYLVSQLSVSLEIRLIELRYKKGRGTQQFSLICLFKIFWKKVLRNLSISLIFITKKNTQK